MQWTWAILPISGVWKISVRGGWKDMADEISGYAYDDTETRAAVREIKDQYDYVMDPHGAVGYLAAKAHRQHHPEDQIVILETAHPAKFLPVMEPILGSIIYSRKISSLE